LFALALAWLSRAKVETGLYRARAELGHPDMVRRARTMINRALKIQCSPWIRYRVKLISGDIALREDNPEKALSEYRDALMAAAMYGNEGRDGASGDDELWNAGYQMLPRLGAAYLALGDLMGARRCFEELKGFERIGASARFGDLVLNSVEKGNLAEAVSPDNSWSCLK